MSNSSEKKGGRIASIEFLRFIVAVFIAFAHFEQLTGAETEYFSLSCVFVEFFFMITGFYMMSGVAKNASQIAPLESVAYSFKKAKSIYAVYFLALILTFIVNVTISSPVGSFAEALERLFHFKWEFAYLQMLGFNQAPQFNLDYLLGPGWYLSAMFIALVPTYFLARRFKKTFADVIAPIAACSIYYYIIQTYGTLDVGNETLPFAMLGVVRALAGLFFGAFVFAVYQRVLNNQEKKSVKTAGTIAQSICYILVFAMPLFAPYTTHKADMIIYLPIFAVLLIFSNISGSKINGIIGAKPQKAFLWMGKLSLYVYLFHWGLLMALKDFFAGFSGFWGYALYILMVLVLSILMMLFVEKVLRKSILKKKETHIEASL